MRVQITFLGHVVNEKGIRADQKVHAVIVVVYPDQFYFDHTLLLVKKDGDFENFDTP